MGWAFVILGLISGAIGAFMVYYGLHLVNNPVEHAKANLEKPVLQPAQERLLRLLAEYQTRFATHKLVVSRRDGRLYFDDDPEKGKGISLIQDLYGPGADAARSGEFQRLVESMPSEYVRLYGESRLDNPFVVGVSELGMRYLRAD